MTKRLCNKRVMIKFAITMAILLLGFLLTGPVVVYA